MMPWVFSILFSIYALVVLLVLGALLTWIERKQAAVMADRIGANRCYIRIPFTNHRIIAWGLFHAMADGLKMLLKENFHPSNHDRLLYAIAPWLMFIPVLLTFAVIPFGGHFTWNGTRIPMQIAPLDGGLLVIFAISGISVLGNMIAGFSSNNIYSLLGSARAAAQMISYEVSLGLSLIGVILLYGTLNLDTMVEAQTQILFGVLPAWGIFLQPLAAILFLIAAMAENKRAPFDLPEAESELIAGFFTEFSAMKMGLFMFAEFIEVAIISAVFVTLFLGGYNLPYMNDAGFQFPWGPFHHLSPNWIIPIQLITFLLKVLFMSSIQVLIRWTLPRFRYDQLIRFGWKTLLPFSLVNLIVTTIVLWWRAT